MVNVIQACPTGSVDGQASSRPGGRAANWAEVMDVAEERTIRASVAAAATATLVTLTADEETRCRDSGRRLPELART